MNYEAQEGPRQDPIEFTGHGVGIHSSKGNMACIARNRQCKSTSVTQNTGFLQ
jgi:hypothetical protein